MADCEHNCGSCDKSCSERDFRASLRAGSSVKKVIGIVSGKGGVGKSLVTSLLASKVNKDGFWMQISQVHQFLKVLELLRNGLLLWKTKML